ncbi:MAG: septum formation initiator family protein [Candidatus Levybacteria bacterium]|nr:septum formation initiator family protein [Candidatus Levybacteria bacterium]
MRKILFFLTLTASVIIIKDLLMSIYSLWQKKDLLIIAQKELSAQKKENVQLQAQLKVVKNPSFIEEEARNKLFFVKPGESVAVIPHPTPGTTINNQPQTASVFSQWVALFFSGESK